MLTKTHIAIGAAAALYFIPHISNQAIFLIVVLVSSLLPNLLQSVFSYKSKKETEVASRDFLHSYTLCIFVSILLAVFYPIFALPFFLGYSFHLLADSFTVRGIKPFWPGKWISSGKIKSGGKMENVVFWVFVFVDAFLVIFFFVK